jgi:hypothetical protein
VVVERLVDMARYRSGEGRRWRPAAATEDASGSSVTDAGMGHRPMRSGL